MADRTIINYEEMQEIARMFLNESQAVSELTSRVHGMVSQLHQGGWIGMGSDQFFDEMEDRVLPGMRRLVEALEITNQATLNIIKEFRQGEQEASQNIKTSDLEYDGSGRGGGSGDSGGAGDPSRDGSGNNNPGSGETSDDLDPYDVYPEDDSDASDEPGDLNNGEAPSGEAGEDPYDVYPDEKSSTDVESTGGQESSSKDDSLAQDTAQDKDSAQKTRDQDLASQAAQKSGGGGGSGGGSGGGAQSGGLSQMGEGTGISPGASMGAGASSPETGPMRDAVYGNPSQVGSTVGESSAAGLPPSVSAAGQASGVDQTTLAAGGMGIGAAAAAVVGGAIKAAQTSVSQESEEKKS